MKRIFRYRNQYQAKRRGRLMSGAAVVEFASIAPLMLLFTFGLIEVGRISMVKQTATHATREGARIAVRPTAVTVDVSERVEAELALLNIQGAVVETVPASIETAPPGSEVTVRVRLDLSEVSWVPSYFHFSSGEMVAESVMRRESTN